MSALNYLKRISIRDSKARQGLSWLLLFSVTFALTGFVGVPSPKPSAGRTAERFPCENCPCGCSTAEYCWDKCCCHTDHEKLAWADRNGVTPPEFLVARVARVAKSSRSVAATSRPSCRLCSGEKAGSCEVSSAESSAKDESVDELGTKAILMWKAAECRGISYFWTMMAAVYVEPTHKFVQIDPPLLGWITFYDEHASSHLIAPDPPIP